MARSASFLRQFIADFWDLLPKKDLDWLGAYWHALTMIVADLYNEAFETALATTVQDVQVFRTERWNQYQLNSTTATLTTKTDSLVLTGTTPANLTEDAVLFDTLSVTNTNGNIYFSETKTLIDETTISLTYGTITPGTVRVAEGGAVFRENRDYRLNLALGQISRVSGGGIPSGTLVTVTYMHSTYKKDLDYVLDEVNRTIARIASGNITSGDVASVGYTYDASVADLLGGKGAINSTASILTDNTKDFTGVLPGRTLTISSGVNVGTYTVLSVVSAIEIKITGSFTADDNAAIYTINAFPYAISTTSDIASIPTMQDLIVDPTQLFREGVDYQVGTNKISFRVVPPTTRINEGPTLWAEESLLDEQTVYRNFGVLIDFFRESSEDYLSAVKGLWYAYWTGSTNENLKRGMHILVGLPFATDPGTVTSITTKETLILDVSTTADITPEPVRTANASATDSITATDTVIFPGAVGSNSFTSADIGRLLRITGSAAGNDGYYTIASLISAQSVTVTPTTLSSEGAGFVGRIYEASPIDYFAYASNTFTVDDVGRTLRVSNSTAANDGDYIIAEIVAQNSVRISLDDAGVGFNAKEGAGGFTVRVYQIDDDTITVTDDDGESQIFTVPTGLEATVSVGDTVAAFDRLTTGVRIFDKISDPGFVSSKLGRVGIQRFLTQNASIGIGNSDETKALIMLEEHLWLPQILTSAASETINVTEIFTFLQNLKPKWSEFVFSFADDFEEQLTFVEDLKPEDIVLIIDLTTILRSSWPNIAQTGQTQYQSTTGETLLRTLRSPSAGLDISVPSRLTATDGAFTEDDEGRTATVSGSGAGNDGDYIIDKVLSATSLLVSSSTDFTADEVGVFSLDIKSLTQLRDANATFTSDAALNDVVTIASGSNQGNYRILEVIDDNNLVIFENAFDGPFNAAATGISFEIISHTWFQDQGSVDFLEHFLHERTDGAVTAGSTFTVDSSLDLFALGVQAGFLLAIKSGPNIEVYNVTAVPTKTTVTVAEVFPTSPNSPEDYAICQAALKREDSFSTILEVIPV